MDPAKVGAVAPILALVSGAMTPVPVELDKVGVGSNKRQSADRAVPHLKQDCLRAKFCAWQFV